MLMALPLRTSPLTRSWPHFGIHKNHYSISMNVNPIRKKVKKNEPSAETWTMTTIPFTSCIEVLTSTHVKTKHIIKTMTLP